MGNILKKKTKNKKNTLPDVEASLRQCSFLKIIEKFVTASFKKRDHLWLRRMHGLTTTANINATELYLPF